MCAMPTRSPLQAFLRKRQHTHLPTAPSLARSNSTSLQHHSRTCQAYRAARALLDISPSFDEPPRQPSDAEARAVAAGATLTPQQQLAKQIDLPVTLRIKSAPGRPTDRQLMIQIQSAVTWKELEAVVYQQRNVPLPTTAAAAAAAVNQQRTLPPAAAAAVEVQVEVDVTTTAAAASKDTANPQQQQQQQQEQWKLDSQLPRRQPRRRQAPKPLSVEPQPAGSAQNAAAAAGSSTQLPPPAAAAAAPYNQGLMARPSDLLNHLHVTEAMRRLVLLLPRNPGQLAAADRSRAAALVDFLTQQATAQIYNLEMDARGLAHVAAASAKLGHKDKFLISELQEAAIMLITTFESQHVAMLLGALVGLGVPPNAQLLAALQRHVSENLHLFTHQSLANTIWALAKLSSVVGIQQQQQQQRRQQRHAAEGSAADPDNASAAAAAAAGIDARLVKRLLYRCDPQMHLWSPVHLCQVVWGLGKLGAMGDASWCRSVLKATRKHLSKMTPRDLANVISGLPELGAVPDQEWLDAFCVTAAAKMKFAEPMAVYSILFGVAKVKQAHRKAQRTAAKQRQIRSQLEAAAAAPEGSQQQQQQQGWMSRLEQQEENTAQQQIDQPGQQQQQQQEAGTRQQHQSLEQQQQQEVEPHPPTASGDIPKDETIPREDLGNISLLTAAEVKMLCAAAMWIERLQSDLTQWQLAGVIIALSQLLPAGLLQQAGALQQQQQQQDRDEQRGPRQQGVVEEQRKDDRNSKEWLSDELYLDLKQRKLVHLLSQLIPGWQEQQEQVGASLPKKRARLFKLAWGRLMQQYNAGSTDHQQ